RSGAIDEPTAETRLRSAGFPDRDNPYAGASRTSVVEHPLRTAKHAAAAVAQFRPQNPVATHNAAVLQAGQGALVPVRAEQPAAGVVGVTPSLPGQVIQQVGQGLVNAPGAVPALVEHPIGTGRRVLGHIEHPNLANAAFLGYVGAVGGATAL